MKTSICELLGIEVPLLAFSHCRDVVAAVTNAGGFGVLGVAASDPEHLDQELSWIDEQVDGKPYGADILVPNRYEGRGEMLSYGELAARIPQEHRDYVTDILQVHGIAEDSEDTIGLPLIREDIGHDQIDVALNHPIRLLANGLGVPSVEMLDAAHQKGVLVAALVGTADHAVNQVRAGVDVLVAQGTEAGGHTGQIATMVLVPEVIAAIDSVRRVPVLAAGGIVTGRQMAAAVTLGAAGVWTGSVWLTTEEAETAPATVAKMLAASSKDTTRSTGRTGKPARQLTSEWTSAWEPGVGPGALSMPLQSMLVEKSLKRIDALAEQDHAGAKELATYFVGQGVGLMNKVKPAREVVYDFALDYIDAVQRAAATIE
ncbi:nitronate monooxygenase [Mycolicibacterium neoaurum]|uniref:nitronate monooxygenase n=1 Tax=Mycolicibacterium neoaurum TaxID=1795 RepID=UPI0026733C5B|nr:nitronate monooxygenase [Mycolicibacterium neoaurum]MDO3401697.1 nitronate monooxygenase [Mycolicibacterium neoaurum]